LSISIKRIGPKPPEINREYKKRPLPVTGTGKFITVLPSNYKPAPTYEIPPEDPERRKRIIEAQKRAIAEKKAEAEKPKRKPRQNRVWTPEMIAKFKALYSQGLTYPQIASEMGMKRTQINAEAYYLKEQGEIDSRLPCNAWSADEVEQLHKLRQQGLSIAKCAKKLHRSTGSVESRLRREAEKC
jgi:biotin operon repressor